MTRGKYVIYLNAPGLGVVPVADMVLAEDGNGLSGFGLKYREEYLDHPDSFDLDPQFLKRANRKIEIVCNRATPGILDDYLPDDWGRKVLSAYARYQLKRKIHSSSAIDLLRLLTDTRTGAVAIVESGGDVPHFNLGVETTMLERISETVVIIDEPESAEGIDLDIASLLYLSNNSSGIGGARPKALVVDESGSYIAKINRQRADAFNHARVELACITMACEAGIRTSGGKIHADGGREALLVNRFDVNADGSRNHMITMKALLKDPETQADYGLPFRYDLIHQVLKRYSGDIIADSRQLLLQMLFNRAINNTDDHERNFSLMYWNGHYQLSPAYDLVPSLHAGEYHNAGYRYAPDPPSLSEAIRMNKIFGLGKPFIQECCDLIASSVAKWECIADQCGVSEEEIEKVRKVFSA